MDGSPWGGSEELWSATAREAIEAGCQVAFSTRKWPDTPDAVKDLVKRGALWLPWTSRLSDGRAKRWLGRLSRRVPIAKRLFPAQPSSFKPLFDFRPDIVCVNQGGTFDVLYCEGLLELLYHAQLPYVALCRWNADDYFVSESLRPEGREFFRRAFRVGFAAERNIRMAERQLTAKIPHGLVLQSPVNIPGFAAVPWPSQALPSFACVSRLNAAHKGHDLLLESLSSPTWKNREWRLRFFGEGPDQRFLEELIRYFGLGDRVSFAGHVRDISGIWQQNHLLILPSRAEGTPQSMIQAMVCGRPVVVTEVGGTGEWVTEPTTGFIAEAASMPSISRALERAWQAQAEWQSIGQAARRTALAKLDKAPQRTLFGLLKSCLEGRAGPRHALLTHGVGTDE